MPPAGRGATVSPRACWNTWASRSSPSPARPCWWFRSASGRDTAGAAHVVGPPTSRALPALGLLTLVALWLGISIVPSLVVLVIIAAAPLLSGVLEGLASVPEELVDAARAQGLTEWQILTRVEIPLGLQLMLGGLRSALVQVIATATIVAYVSGGTLGRYLFDGLAVRDYPRMLVATLLVALLAFVVDALMGLVQRWLTPAGLAINRRKA